MYAPSWSEVFIAAAGDDKSWDREVCRPALRFLASGAKVSESTHALKLAPDLMEVTRGSNCNMATTTSSPPVRSPEFGGAAFLFCFFNIIIEILNKQVSRWFLKV